MNREWDAMRAVRGMVVAALWTMMPPAGAAPRLSVTIDPRATPSVPPGALQVPAARLDPGLFDTLALFDFTAAPIGGNPPAPTAPDAQRLDLTDHVHAVIVPVDGAPQRHALHFDAIPQPNQESAVSFVSKPFDPATRKTVTVVWDGQFHPAVATIRVVVTLGARPSFAEFAFRDGQVSLVTLQGYKPFATYVGAKVAPSGKDYLPSEHRVSVTCTVVTGACTATFTQGGTSAATGPFTIYQGPALPAPAGSQRLVVKVTWPKQETAPFWYDVRRVAVSGGR